MTSVKPLKKFLKSQRLKCFGHIERMSKEEAPAMSIKISVKDKKKGRPKT